MRSSPIALAVLAAAAASSSPANTLASADSELPETSCFDADGGFSEDVWAYCQPVSPGLFLYYTPPPPADAGDPSSSYGDGNVLLGLRAPGHTDGWSALALAGNGGMKGASQIVVRRDVDGGEGGEWIAEDRYSEEYETPRLDSSQDVKLLFARQDGQAGTSWGVAIRSDSCDDEDYPVEDRAASMHWALGYGHSFAFHGDRRGQFLSNLMRAPSPSSSSSVAAAEGRSSAGWDDDEGVIDVLMPNVSVAVGPESGGDPSNPYLCAFFDLEELRKEHEIETTGRSSAATGGAIHVTRFSPAIDPESSSYVHHMILYGCDDGMEEEVGYEHRKVVNECVSMPRGCFEMKWPWAVGGSDVVFPPDVGMPLGGPTGNRWMLLQMHYYNPKLDEGVRDSSGVRVHFTPNLREVDAGVMQLNGGVSPYQRPPLPAGEASVAIPNFVVPSACTEPWEEPINIIGTGHHEHIAGKYMSIDVVRDGRNLGPIRLERRYDFNHQSLEDSAMKQLLPGDEFIMTCEYDTSSRTEDVVFGDLSQNEMCYAVILYYPAKVGRDTFSYISPDGRKGKVETACSSPGTDDGFEDVSMCAQSYVSSIPAYFDLDIGGLDFGALELCNSDMYETAFEPYFPGSCPPCHADRTCTVEDVKAFGQDVLCPRSCGDFGLSVYPDDARTISSVTHGAACSWTEPVRYFEHVPPAPPAACRVEGDLEVALEEKEPADSGSGAGSLIVGLAAWGAVAAAAFVAM